MRCGRNNRGNPWSKNIDISQNVQLVWVVVFFPRMEHQCSTTMSMDWERSIGCSIGNWLTSHITGKEIEVGGTICMDSARQCKGKMIVGNKRRYVSFLYERKL